MGQKGDSPRLLRSLTGQLKWKQKVYFPKALGLFSWTSSSPNPWFWTRGRYEFFLLIPKLLHQCICIRVFMLQRTDAGLSMVTQPRASCMVEDLTLQISPANNTRYQVWWLVGRFEGWCCSQLHLFPLSRKPFQHGDLGGRDSFGLRCGEVSSLVGFCWPLCSRCPCPWHTIG